MTIGFVAAAAAASILICTLWIRWPADEHGCTLSWELCHQACAPHYQLLYGRSEGTIAVEKETIAEAELQSVKLGGRPADIATIHTI